MERAIYGVFNEVAVWIKISTFYVMSFFHNMIAQNDVSWTKSGNVLLIRNSTGLYNIGSVWVGLYLIQECSQLAGRKRKQGKYVGS